MKSRYEIKDSHYPAERGMRFTSLSRAEKELAQSVPAGRFYIYDRAVKGKIVWAPESGWL